MTLPHAKPREATLGSVVESLLRGWRVILLSGAIGGTVTYLSMSASPPRYTANAQVMLETRERNIVGSDEVFPGFRLDDRTIASEVAVLRSRGLVSEAVANYGLGEKPGFGAELTRDRLEGIRSLLRPATERPKPDNRKVIDSAIGTLRVSQVGISAVIGVSFAATDPDVAAGFLNALVDTYVEKQASLRRDETRQAAEFLALRVESLREELKYAEGRLASQRETLAIAGSGGIEALETRSGATALEAAVAQAARVELEARMEQITSTLAAGHSSLTGTGSSIGALVRLLDPSVAALLQSEENAARGTVEQLALQFGANHPERRAAEAALAAAKARLSDAVLDRTQALLAELSEARGREALLLEAAGEEEANIAELMRDRIALEEADREAAIARSLYEAMAMRLSEVRAQEALARADARVIARAEPPRAPSAPRPKLSAVAGAMALALIAGAAVILREGLRAPYRRAEEAADDLQAPLVARIARRRKTSLRRFIQRIRRAEMSLEDERFMEGLRAIDAAVRSRGARTIAIVSAARGEGKSATCLGLAVAARETGARVRIIDADLREPALSRALGRVSQTRGFANTLTTRELPDIEMLVPGIEIVPAGSDRLAATAQMRTRKWVEAAVAGLKEDADLVIIDTPAAMAFADAAILASVADFVLFIVADGRTPRDEVAAAARQLLDLGARIDAVAVTFSSERISRYARSYTTRKPRLWVVGGSR